MSRCYLGHSCAYSTASSMRWLSVITYGISHASGSRRPQTACTLWSLICAGNNVANRQHKPFSPEITTRVTGNESLHQRNAVFVKSEKQSDNTFMRALK